MQARVNHIDAALVPGGVGDVRAEDLDTAGIEFPQAALALLTNIRGLPAPRLVVIPVVVVVVVVVVAVVRVGDGNRGGGGGWRFVGVQLCVRGLQLRLGLSLRLDFHVKRSSCVALIAIRRLVFLLCEASRFPRLNLARSR